MQDAIRKARELLDIVGPLNLAEFEYTDELVSIRFSREGPSAAPAFLPAPAAAAPAALVRSAPAAGTASAPAVESDVGKVKIQSPMVGTFYSAPSPDKPPYVNVGDTVEKGQVVCIIEAMKLMNEIKSPARGRIAKIFVENAAPVAKDEVLFQLDPA